MQMDKKKKAEKKKKLNKETKQRVRGKRESSLRLMRGRSLLLLDYSKLERETMELWIKLIKSRGQTIKECPQLNHAQFNLCMMDNEIQIDPDLSISLFWRLVSTYDRKKLAKSVTLLTPSSPIKENEDSDNKNDDKFPDTKKENIDENEMDESNKELAQTIMKQREKRIKKSFITPKHLKYIIRAIEKNIDREDLIANPSTLNEKTKHLVIFSKIFENIQSGNAFDVVEDYLSQRLSPEVLDDPIQCLGLLETRTADWKHRVQVMEHIEQNIDKKGSLAPLYEDEENFLSLMFGWSTQLYDDRSNVTKPAAELFPSLLGACLTEMEDSSVLFNTEDNLWSTIFESLFVLLRNRRAKQLANIAKSSIIQVVDLLASIMQSVDEKLFHTMMDLFIEKCQFKNEKHEVIRAGCVTFTSYLIYGIEREDPPFLEALANQMKNINTNNTKNKNNIPFIPKSTSLDVSMSSPAISDDEVKTPDGASSPVTPEPEKLPTKLAKDPQRDFLFEDKEFMKLVAKIVELGINDKSKETRDETMKLLKHTDTKKYSKIMEEFVDPISWKKYQKWKLKNQPKQKKKRKRIPISQQMKMKKMQSTKLSEDKEIDDKNELMNSLHKSKSVDVSRKKRVSLTGSPNELKHSIEKHTKNMNDKKNNKKNGN